MVLKKYFPVSQREKTVSVQARIPLKLAKELAMFKKEKHLSWTKLILGSLQALNDETKGKKR